MDNTTLALKYLVTVTLNAQSACNLTALAHGFARTMTTLSQLYPDASTDTLNAHPIAVLWVDKLAQLAGIQNIGHDRVMDAYRAVYAIRDAE